MAEKNKLEISTTPAPVVQLSKPILITAGTVAASLILFAIIGSFSNSKHNSSKNSNGIASMSIEKNFTAENKINISPEIHKLPEDYTNIEGIRKFLASPKEDHRLEIVLRQLEDLQNEYQYLKRQFDLKKNDATELPLKSVDNEKTAYAKTADLIFAGLGSNTENALDNKSKPTNEDKLIATPAQEEFLKNEAINKRRIEVAKGKDRTESIYDMHNMVRPISKYQIQAGTTIPAILDTGIDTTIVGTIVAHVKSNIYDTITGKYLLIPKGSKLIGEYDSRTTPGQRRILMEFGRIIRPDGSSILLGRALGADAIGQSGVGGDVNNHWARILGAATISSILTVGAAVGADNIDGHNNYYQSATQRGIGGAVNSVNNVAQNITNQALTIKPTINIQPGREFYVMVRKDMILDPFNSRRK